MSLAQPIWLLALLLLPVLALAAVLAWRARGKRWRALVAARLEDRLVIGAGRLGEWLALALLLLGTACVIGALARPQGEASDETETVRGRNVIIMIDVSRSMLTEDVKPSRLEHAKATAHEMVEALPNDRIGIIALAGRPFLVAPMTIDHAAVHETISQLDEETILAGGTDLGSAMGLAVGAFKETGQRNNGLIILSDGEDHAEGLKEAAEEARAAGVFIFAVGIGTAQGELIPNRNEAGGLFLDRNGREVVSRLEERKLRQLATDTNGRYLSSAAGGDIPAMVQDAVAGLDQYEIQSATRAVPLEFYQWLLLPGVILWIASVVVATRWGTLKLGPQAAILLALAALTFEAPGARAAEPAAAGLAAEREKLGRAAEDSRGDRRAAFELAGGNAAYALGDWPDATVAFSAALLARDPQLQAASHYNLGTALFQQGWQALTSEPRYPGAERGPAAFEEAITRRFDEWNKVPATPDSPSPTFELLGSVTEFWTDAITHFQSAIQIDDSPTARANLASARHYLQQLRDALEQQDQELEEQLTPEEQQQQQQGGSGEGDPQQGAEPQEGQQPNNDGSPPQDGSQGQQPQDPRPGEGGDPQDPNSSPGDGGEEPQEQPGAGENPNRNQGDNGNDTLDRDFQPGETKAERARRLLGESADLERSPVPPGRREFRRPEKDW